jgi:hypothetical protein
MRICQEQKINKILSMRLKNIMHLITSHAAYTSEYIYIYIYILISTSEYIWQSAGN